MLYDWQFILFACYSFPLIALYIFVIIILIGSKDFKAPFFRLAIVLGLVDIFTHYSIWFQLKFPWSPITGPWVNARPIPWFFIGNCFVSYYFPQVREMLILFSSFNRFTALAMPHRQKELWLKILWPLVILSFIIPFPLSFHLLFGKFRTFPFYFNSTIQSYVIEVKASWFPFNMATLNFIYVCITCCLTFIVNLLTVYQLFIRTRGNSQSGSIISASNKTEINLLIVSIWDFVLSMIYTLHQLTMWLMPDPYDPWFDRIYLLTPWIFDIVDLSRPPILIYMCKQLQVAITRVTKGKKFQTSIGTITVTVTSSSSRPN